MNKPFGQPNTKGDLIKLKNFCAAKETINKTKSKPLDWEKIFVNDATYKDLISKTYQYFMRINNKTKQKQITQLKNGQKT